MLSPFLDRFGAKAGGFLPRGEGNARGRLEVAAVGRIHAVRSRWAGRGLRQGGEES